MSRRSVRGNNAHIGYGDSLRDSQVKFETYSSQPDKQYGRCSAVVCRTITVAENVELRCAALKLESAFGPTDAG
ncbi:hypothetical protein HYE67_008646 [Fusarium culmorum]|uniref:Uncharacterized protein n=1 Tax=Fusarium culmorum TaxID=5516 RepID=A0A7S8HZB8_FUSCU|nr:hypothetical protein HYE67_008646 [Fusarium culmorum]